MSGERAASIDIGSNTALLLVADPSPTGWIAVESVLEIPRISRGLDAEGTLEPASVARTAAVFAAYRTRLDALGVAPERTVVTGTAPFRRAENGAATAAHLSEVIGVQVDVVSGEAEAALSVLATTTSFPELTRMRVIDIGGASTELTVVDGESRAGVSLDIGSVRLHERCVHHDPPTVAEGAAVDAAVAAALGPLESGADLPLVGIAGTVTTLAAIALDLVEYDAERVHGSRLERAEIGRIIARLHDLDVEARCAIPGLDPGRADVIYAGARLLAGIMDHFGHAACIVSDRGLQWGRLYQAFGDGRT